MKILVPSVRKRLKEFDIKYDQQDPVPSDDALADRLHEASIEGEKVPEMLRPQDPYAF